MCTAATHQTRYRVLQVAEKSLEVGEGAADEGVEWMRNEPYDNTGASPPPQLLGPQ
jgi:hypothetical protein